MLPSSDTLLLAGGAQMAGCAGATGLLIEVDADEFAAFYPRKALLEQFAGWVPIGVGLGLMDEHGFAPEATRRSL